MEFSYYHENPSETRFFQGDWLENSYKSKIYQRLFFQN